MLLYRAEETPAVNGVFALTGMVGKNLQPSPVQEHLLSQRKEATDPQRETSTPAPHPDP